MDSSSSLPGRSSEPNPPNQWASIIGSIIAFLTLTIPPTIITYYSGNDTLERFETTPSAITQSQNSQLRTAPPNHQQ